MSRYIDRDVLRKAITEYVATPLTPMTPQDIVKVVWNAPTADVVAVVRCKDCKHWNNKGYDPILESAFGECLKSFEDYHCCETTEGDYCSYGDRREE